MRCQSCCMITTTEWCKAPTEKTHHYSSVKATLRVSLTLLKVKKIICENINFVLNSSFFFLSLFLPLSCITQNFQGIYEYSKFRMTDLITELFLLWFTVVCKLQLESYTQPQTHMAEAFYYVILCILQAKFETTGHLQLYNKPNDSLLYPCCQLSYCSKPSTCFRRQESFLCW